MAEGRPQGRLWSKANRRLREAGKLLRHPKRLWREHRRLTTAAGVAALVGLVGIVVAYEQLKRPPDVHNPTAPFKPEKPKRNVVKTVNWPIFGLNRARTRYLPASRVKPPYRLLWHYTERPLLEFPPIYVGGKLYAVNNSANAFALDADTGKVLWERRLGLLNASSPAYSKHRLYIVNLVPGHVVKLDAKTGKILWKRSLPNRAESSPLVIGRNLYFGCEDGRLYALSTRNGNVRWSTQLGGPVKSAPAYYGGTLFVGDYGGEMNAVDAKTGALKWQSGSLGPGFGGTGAFYSTPAVAFGRVYAGNNDSRVYSFDLSNGELAWSYSTGGYVYSGPTVAKTRHTGPTVYIGSFDGNVYALNARNGEPRWIHSAGGSVIGSLTAIGNIVYAAEFTNGSTEGFMMKTGRQVFHYKTGTYTPVISDGRRLYLVGYSSINALQPFHPRRAKSRSERRKRGHRRPTPHSEEGEAGPARGKGRETGSG